MQADSWEEPAVVRMRSERVTGRGGGDGQQDGQQWMDSRAIHPDFRKSNQQDLVVNLP